MRINDTTVILQMCFVWKTRNEWISLSYNKMSVMNVNQVKLIFVNLYTNIQQDRVKKKTILDT